MRRRERKRRHSKKPVSFIIEIFSLRHPSIPKGDSL